MSEFVGESIEAPNPFAVEPEPRGDCNDEAVIEAAAQALLLDRAKRQGLPNEVVEFIRGGGGGILDGYRADAAAVLAHLALGVGS